MAEATDVHVQVCYALPKSTYLCDLTLPAGSSARQAILASDVLQRFTAIDLENAKIGIFGKLKALDSIVSDGDRVEIYRPLQADPKESRRRRAAHKARNQP